MTIATSANVLRCVGMSQTSPSKILAKNLPLWMMVSLSSGFAGVGAVHAQAVSNVTSNATVADAQTETTLIRSVANGDPLAVNQSVADNRTAQVITSVQQMTDVKPTDWAYGALQNLTDKYQCISGYPDNTFRGRNTLTRFEFAAALNQCLEKFSAQMMAGGSDRISKADLATIQKLQDDFAAELKTLSARVDRIEGKVNTIEAQQFSTTTKLSGSVYFNITGASSADVRQETGVRATTGVGAIAPKPNTTMSGLAWLTLNTSFTGKDQLVTQLGVGNGDSPYNSYVSSGFFNTTGVPFTDQTAGAGANQFILRELSYTFPVMEKGTLVVGPRVNFYKYFDAIRFINPANSTFNSINSTLLTNAKRGAGAVFMTPMGSFDFKLGYLAESNEFGPGPGGAGAGSATQGLFGGNSALSTEIGYKPNDAFAFRLLYSRTNAQANAAGQVGGAGFTPSLPGLADDGAGGALTNGQSDIFTANFDWLMSKGFGLFGRYGIGSTNLNKSTGSVGSVTMQTFQVGMAFPDLFKEGAMGLLSFGMPFNYTGGKQYMVSGVGNGGTQYDLEAAYSVPVSKNISLIPSAYLIFSPNNFSNNPTVFVGSMRMQFSF